MKISHKTTIACIYGAFILTIVAGCGTPIRVTESPTITHTSWGTPSKTILISTATTTPTTIPTMTLSPTDTPIPTNTGTTTPIYLPTLPPEQAKALMLELLQTNGGCQLPCWWGITPGVTTWEETLRIVSPIASGISIYEREGGLNAAVSFNNHPEGIDPFGFDTIIKDGIVQDLSISSYGPGGIPFYSLSNVLDTYGKPEEVWVDAYSPWACDYSNGQRLLTIRLFYPKQGIFAQYDAWGEAGDTIIQARMERGPSLYLWSPTLNLTYSETFMKAGLLPGDNPSLPVLEAFGMDTATFYQTYKNDVVACVETPRELWNWCGETPTPTP